MEANLLITGNCNLKCRHCSVSSHGELNKDLPLSAWVEILDELKKSKVIRLTLTGGEPLVRSDFTDFVSEISRRPFRFTVNTNGTLISDEVIEAVTNGNSRFDGFMVSLDGPDKKTVDSQRGEGVFNDLLKGVEKLRVSKIPFGFYCTVTSLNVESLNETAELAFELGADWIKFNNFVYAGPVLDRRVIPDNKAVIRAALKLRFLEHNYPGRITGSLINMRKRIEELRKGKLPRTDGKAYSCGGGRSRIAIFPDGRVTPCDHLPDYTLGNITKNSLESILTGKRMDKFTKFMKQPRRNCSFCSSCEYMKVCTGGCPVEPLSCNESIGYDRHSCLKLAMEET